MAKKEEKPERGPGFLKKSYVTTTNVGKTLFNFLRGKTKLHYRSIGKQTPHVVKRLKVRHNYIELLKVRLEELRSIEERSTKQHKIKKQIEECYMKMGPYDEATSKKEFHLFKFGHPDGSEGVEEEGGTEFTGDKKIVYDVDEIEIKRREFDKLSFKFPVPKKFEFVYPRGFVENVSAFGKENDSQWVEAYNGVINKMCDDVYDKMCKYVDKEYTNEEIREEKKTILDGNIRDLIGIAAKNVISTILQTKISPQEHKFYTKLKGEGEKDSVSKYAQQLKALKNEMLQNVPEKVRHKHTYKIIRRLTEEEKEKLKDVIPPRTKIGETEIGLDENMRELEVAGPGGYVYNKKHYPEGTILIDIWDANDETYFEENKITESGIRKVPKEYITEVDLLDMAAYIHNEWDEYRDDLRDARYHPHTMLAIDYAMALNNEIKTEWKKGWNTKREIFAPWLRERWRKYDMKLGDGSVLKDQIRRALNLNPAFDKEAWKIPGQEWEYIGKRYYYDTVVMTIKYYRWDQKDPIMTTRGISHYIIQKVIRETKYFDQAHKALLEISRETGGFDYGPRRFGDPFHKDPFEIDLTKVNEALPAPEEDYKKGVGRDGE